ncbi:peptide-methionine (R)-S-oxide reductase MsrB [Rhizobiaceae bacterium]|nr:peptide-methionine (R)-S-oxide reductase MsrB [Rhizobiaceae bacterium]
MTTRRNFLAGSAAVLVAAVGASSVLGMRVAVASEGPLATATNFGHDLITLPVEPVEKTEAEWRALLSPEQFAVLREEATERPFTSDLLKIKTKGTYACAGCALPLYRSEVKFDSRTGWPSFSEGIEGALDTKNDYGLFVPRTEVHCIRCGGHQGHIFEDGPKPTGNRHCINGIALTFVADDATG